MGIFNKSKMIYGSSDLTPVIANEIANFFRSEGYEVCVMTTSNGTKEISITKGGLFMRCLGMRSALNITLQPCVEGIWFKTDVGIFGNQVIPAILVISGMWIVLVPQIWGLIRQSKLDDKALEIAEKIVYRNK